ncbi:MAG: hypothetical protein F6K24_26470 [Okeania sp. SIO2D1]|nr:hypothetical protein [Okeania sp. SIO2D1]
MLKNPFKLEKLKIYVYKDRSRNDFFKDTFEVMFNPESYSLKYENVYQSYQGINTSGREAKYSLTKPQNLSLKLILDDTGVADYGMFGLGVGGFVGKLIGKKDVYEQVQYFLQLTTDMNGEIHEPKFLQIAWGDLIFDCRLQSVQINYTLFNRSGQPIRAELDTVFIGDIQDSKRIKKENKSSPDLSHSRTVKSGDKLPLMAQEIYGNSAYYIQLARANNVNNLRKLKVGTNIKLPPINKEV